MLKRDNPEMVTISHFAPNEEDRVTQSRPDLPSLLVAISSVGGNYGDWVSFVRECGENGYLTEPFAMNPLPSAGRVFDRTTKQSVTSRNEPGETLPESTFHASKKTDNEKNDAAWYNPFTWGK